MSLELDQYLALESTMDDLKVLVERVNLCLDHAWEHLSSEDRRWVHERDEEMDLP